MKRRNVETLPAGCISRGRGWSKTGLDNWVQLQNLHLCSSHFGRELQKHAAVLCYAILDDIAGLGYVAVLGQLLPTFQIVSVPSLSYLQCPCPYLQCPCPYLQCRCPPSPTSLESSAFYPVKVKLTFGSLKIIRLENPKR